jgi:hypothetical protein
MELFLLLRWQDSSCHRVPRFALQNGLAYLNRESFSVLSYTMTSMVLSGELQGWLGAACAGFA